MSDPVAVITFGDEEFSLAHVSAQEVIKVKAWTGCKNRQEWFTAITEEDPEALVAALVLAKQRKGETVRFADADFDFDDLDVKFVDDQGREVEPINQTNDDGSLKLDAQGRPLPSLDKDGKQQWRDVTSGEVIPFVQTA